MDSLLTSSGASTDGTGLVAATQVGTLPGTVSPTTPSVNPVQTPSSPATAATPVVAAPAPLSSSSIQPADVSALIAQYEARIRNLMSEKDKALHERNQAISHLTTLQKEYDDSRAMNNASLQASVDNAQAAINEKKVLEQQVTLLQGETLRAKTLLEKPHLAAYAQFIPVSSDPEKVKAAVDQLEQIRHQDLQRSLGLGRDPQQTNAHTTNATVVAGAAGTPAQATLPNGQVDPAFASLYAGRQNLPTSLLSAMPGSTPAQLNPGALTDPNAAIAQLFDDARRSGRQEDFDRALAQAQVLANAAIAQQMGRSS